MPITTDIDQLLRELNIVDKLYDDFRLVDPLHHQVTAGHRDQPGQPGPKCYEVWGRGKACENCISMRAVNEGRTFVKIEYSPRQIFMVTAVPVDLEAGQMVFELMKDTTQSLLFENEAYGSSPHDFQVLIDNLNKMALRDALTEVYNRRYIMEKLPLDLINARLAGQNLALIMADIDCFKLVNDTYGHIAGDMVLKRFSQALGGCLQRDSDWLSRYGGEEFLICLPGAGLDKAREIADKMRRRVAAQDIAWGQATIKITSSFGICSTIPTGADQMENLIAGADRALYRAKTGGRNRVEWTELGDIISV